MRTTLTFDPLPPKEGEEVIWSGSEHHSREKEFWIRARTLPALLAPVSRCRTRASGHLRARTPPLRAEFQAGTRIL